VLCGIKLYTHRLFGAKGNGIIMELWGITDCGKVRKHNQDVFQISTSEVNDTVVLVVCDGMGGANAGNIASELAADTFMNHMDRHIDEYNSGHDLTYIAELMTEAVHVANDIVYQKSMSDEELNGMGTTLTAAVSTQDGVVVANVGDSRLYHVTFEKITQITRDHSVVEDMIQRGEITRSEAHQHPSKNLITRVLGTSYDELPDIFYIDMKADDIIILCSDGLTNVVTDNEIQFELLRGTNVRESCEVLVDMALGRGAPDNVTVVILKN